MKILYCVPSLYKSGGMERILTEKANWLATHGNQIDILTTEQEGKTPFFTLDPSIKLIDLDINFNKDFNLGLLKKTRNHYRKLRLYRNILKQHIKKVGYDVVVSLCGKEIEFLGKIDISAKKVAELHFSQDFKIQFAESMNRGKLHRLLAKWLTRSFIKSTKNLDALVVLTKEDENQWIKTNSNIRQIYNFTEKDTHPKKGENRIETKRCIAVGRLDEQKGFDLLIPAWEKVAEKHPDWTLDIFGVGKWEDLLKNEIKSRGLTCKVNLKGQSKEIEKEMAESDFFILSSRYEGFPMVMLEAFAGGLPIVAFNCKTGPKEIITDGENGLLVAPGDTDALSRAIIRLIENPGERKKMSEKAIESMMRFDKEKIMNQWQNLFRDLC